LPVNTGFKDLDGGGFHPHPKIGREVHRTKFLREDSASIPFINAGIFMPN
jgi:hypothetical protein